MVDCRFYIKILFKFDSSRYTYFIVIIFIYETVSVVILHMMKPCLCNCHSFIFHTQQTLTFANTTFSSLCYTITLFIIVSGIGTKHLLRITSILLLSPLCFFSK